MLIFNDDKNSGSNQNHSSQQIVIQPESSKRRHTSCVKTKQLKRVKTQLSKSNKDFLKALGLSVN